jgi:hypothetical protein
VVIPPLGALKRLGGPSIMHWRMDLFAALLTLRL